MFNAPSNGLSSQSAKRFTGLQSVIKQTRPVIDQQQRELMMSVLIQHEEAFKIARLALRPEHFGACDAGYALIWRLLDSFYTKNNYLPDRALLTAEISAALGENPETLNSAEIDALNSFFDYAYDTKFKFDISTDSKYRDWSVKMCRQFLEESLAKKFQTSLIVHDQMPSNMPAVIEKIQQEISNLTVLDAAESETAFPAGWDAHVHIDVVSTEIGLLDRFLNGGHAPGEVYGLMGPIGSAKSTTAYMLAVTCARQFIAHNPERPKLSFVFSYEDNLNTMRLRTLCFAARVFRDTLEKTRNLTTDLSHTGALKDYERRLFSRDLSQGMLVPGEYERVQMAVQQLNKNLVLMDMTGNVNRGDGCGGVDEVVARVGNECRRRGAECGVVIFDYVGAMVKRQMAAQNIPFEHLRHMIGGAPLRAKNYLAQAFNCPTWLLHQFSGDANSRSPGMLFHHTDAAEAKNFGENLDFSFEIGVQLKPDNVSLFGCSKARRCAPKPPTTLGVNGDLGYVMCMDDLYRHDAANKRLMRIADWEGLPTTAATPVAPTTSASNLRV